MKQLSRSAAGWPPCGFTLCVCFCVPLSLNPNENPYRSETSVREKTFQHKKKNLPSCERKAAQSNFFVILKHLLRIFSFYLFESVSLLKIVYTYLKSLIFATLSGSRPTLGTLLGASWGPKTAPACVHGMCVFVRVRVHVRVCAHACGSLDDTQKSFVLKK